MEHTTGEGQTSGTGGNLRSGMHLHTGGSDEPLNTGNRQPPGGTGFRGRMAGGVGGLREKLNTALSERPDVFGPIRKYPLVAVGAAFTVGLALASTRRGRSDRHWMVERTRRQLKTILVGTATAALVSELHNLAETDERIRILLGAYLGETPEGSDAPRYADDLEYEDFEEVDDDDDLPPLR
jgi:hypothetical protein